MSTKIADLTITKQSGSVLTLNTKEKYIPDDATFNISVIQGSVTQNAPTVDEDGLVTATTSTTAGFVSTDAAADSNTLQLSTKGAETYPFTTLAGATIPAGKYLTGDQTILQAYTSGIEASNIKYGTTVKVGDTQNNSRIHNVAGSFTRANTVSSGYIAATADKIISGYSAWVDGEEVLGTAASSQSQAKSIDPTESEQTVYPDTGYLLSSVTVGAIDSEYIGSDVPRKDSTDLSVSGKTITAPAGYYEDSASASVALGSVKSGSASISSVSVAYDSTDDKFDVTGSANVSAPSVVSAGYISSSEGTKSANNGAATVSATLPKVTGSVGFSGASTRKPSISKQSTPSGVTNAASGDATTTTPSSGVYVAVKSSANTGTLTATPSVSTEGYGTTAAHGLTANTQTVGALASDTTYVPITTTSASVSGKTVSYGNGWITEGSKSVADGSVTQNAPTVNTTNGLVTATSTVTEGYVSAGTKSNTLQLSTVNGATVSPTESEQTAVAANKYTLGAVKVGAISSTYVGSGIARKSSSDLSASGATVTAPAGYYASDATKTISNTSVTEGTTTVSSSTATRGTWSQTAGYTSARTIAASTFANTATSGQTYVDISGTTASPVLVAGDYLYINKGWTDNLKISLAKLVPDGSDVKGHGEYIISGHSAYDNDGTLVAGTIPTIASTDLQVSGKTVTVPVGKYTGASGATAVSASVADGSVSTTFTGDGMSTYFNSGTSSDKNVTITPKYTNTAGYVAAHSTATNNGGTAYYKIKTTSASVSGDTVSYGTGWITEGSKTVASGTITNNTTLPSGGSSSGTINRGSYIKIGAGYYSADKYYLAQNVSNGTITNNTTLPSGSSSSGTINRGSYIKIGAGYYGSDSYYLAQANSGTKTITGSGNTDVNGYATASVAAAIAAANTASATITSASTDSTSISLATSAPSSGNYYTLTANGSGSSKITTAGWIGTGALNTASTTKAYYVTKASTSTSNGTATATAGTASTSVTGMVTTSTNTGYSVSASATGGNASVTASSATVGAGYNPSSVTASTTAKSATGESASQTKYIQKGVLSASVSSNSGGSASMAATGFTAASSATSYYVTLSTSAGSVKAKAFVGTEGYVKTETNETAATSVAVSGNGNKLYVPAGGYAGSVSSHSVTTTPVVTGSTSGTVTNISSTTKPSGTDGTNYWTITPGGSVTTTGVSTAKGKATISTAGYIPAGNNESGASTVNITPTVSNGTARYISKATSSTSNGTASATANAGTASIAKDPSASASATANGMDGGYYTDSTTSSYYVDCSASAASGYSTATGGSASASVTASSVTVGAGYNPSSVTASTTASSTGNKTGNTATSTEKTASASKKIYLKPAAIAGSSTNATATTTVAPGTVSISKQSTPSGVTNAASGNATTTAPSSGVYVAVKATAAANSTGTTSSISGSGTATVSSAGYAPTTLTGTVSVSGTATAKTSAKDSSMTYVPITTATPAFKGGAISGTATATASGASISTSTNNSGITISAAASATRAKVQYNAAVNGWVSKAASADAYAASSATALTGTTYYLNGVTISKPSSGTRSFAITVPNGSSTVTFTFNVDSSGNVTVT